MKKYRVSLSICFMLLLVACSGKDISDQDLSENLDSTQSQEINEENEVSDETLQMEKNEDTSDAQSEALDSSKKESDSDFNKAPKPNTTPITGTSYAIQKGDTLSSIANRAGLTIQQLMNWNSIANASTIFEGQVLNLAEPESPINAPQPETEQKNTVTASEPESKPENIVTTPEPESQEKTDANISPIPDNWQELAIEEILKYPGTWRNEYQWYEFEHRNGDIYTIIEVHESGKDGSITRLEIGSVNARTIQVEIDR